MRPTDKPLRSLVSSIFSLLEPEASGSLRTERVQSLAEKLAAEKLDLADLITDARRRKPGVGALFLVVDQWEELYTQCRDERAHTLFVAQLRDAMAKGVLSVVCTLRSDFVSKAFDEVDLRDTLDGAFVYLRRMYAEELQSAIEEPAKRVGLEFEGGLVERILNDLGEEPGHLPLLEFVLTELWKRRQGKCLSHFDYQDLGGGRKAIASRAEEIFSALDTDDKNLVRSVFLQLVRPGEGTQDTRRRANIEEIGEAGWKAMQPLVEARLLTTNLDLEDADDSDNLEGSEGTVEITHEALTSHWVRLRKWLDENREFLLWRERLRLARSAWEEESRDVGFLLARAPLHEAEEWLDKKWRDLNPAELEFIRWSLESRQKELEREAWREQRERERKERNRLRLTIGLAVLTLIALFLSGFWFWRWRLSLSRALAAEAAELQDGPLDLALLLSLQARNTADTVQARSSLLTLLEGSPSLKAFLPGDGDRVSRVVFSSNSPMIATGGKDDVFLWDAQTGGRLNPPLKGHQGGILGLAFSPDGSRLVSSGEDKTIRVWRTGDHQPERPELTLPEAVRNLVINPDGNLIAASRGASIYLWDFPGLSSRGEIPQAAASFISDLAFDRSGNLASASNGVVTLWDVARRTPIRAFRAGQRQVLGLAFHPSKDLVATAGLDQTVRLWDATTGQELGSPPEGHLDVVVSVAFSRDGNMLASAGRDRKVLLWDVSHGRWDVSNSRPVATLRGHGQTVWSVAFGKNGDLVSGGDDDAAILWHLQTKPRFAQVPNGLVGEADSVAYDPKGDLLAVGGGNGAIRLWDTVTHRPWGPTLKAHRGPVNGLAFRGRNLISGGADGWILLWNLNHLDSKPQEVSLPDGSAPHGIWSLAVSPDQKTVAAGDDQGSVRLWSLEPIQFLGEMDGRHIGTVNGLAFSPDGQVLASGGPDGLIRLWNVRTRKLLRPPLTGHEDTVSGLAFSPDGRILASCSVDRTVRLWNPATGKQRSGSPLVGPEDPLTAISFDAQGETLAASSLGGRVFLWDVDSLHPIGNGMRGEGKVYSLAIHPDGKRLVTGNDTSVQLFDLRYETWRSEACRTVGRNMTHEEWRKFLRREPYRETCPENVGFANLANRLDRAYKRN